MVRLFFAVVCCGIVEDVLCEWSRKLRGGCRRSGTSFGMQIPGMVAIFRGLMVADTFCCVLRMLKLAYMDTCVRAA